MPYRNVAAQLADGPFASIEYREETGSTNADAAELLGDERFGGHTIVAEFQRHGAGRKGRSWHAMPGTALLISTILPRSIGVDRVWLVPFWVALAVRAGLRACGVVTTLQWPNDLLLRDRKLAGILCQSRVTAATARVACGVGINVHRLAGAGTIIEPAPAFCDEAAPVDRAALLVAILRTYDATMPRASSATGKRPPRSPDGVTESRRTTHESPSRQSRSRSPRAAAYASSATTEPAKRLRWPTREFCVKSCGRGRDGGRKSRRSAASYYPFRRSSWSSTSRNGRYSSA
jgi:BirA family biotin operon repressor/biotin-[acetyl-CoA-carboxylase] ligase